MKMFCGFSRCDLYPSGNLKNEAIAKVPNILPSSSSFSFKVPINHHIKIPNFNFVTCMF